MKLCRINLDRLATVELAALAQRHALDIPPALDRALIIDALLDFAGDAARAAEEAGAEGDDAPAPPRPSRRRRRPVKPPKDVIAPLPARYNVNAVHAIVRDPLWVFVFWELLDAEKQKWEGDPRFSGYFLKVTERGGAAGASEKPHTVPVGSEDCSRYLHFTPGGGTFTVALGAALAGEEALLAETPAFSLPRMLDTTRAAADGNELWALSGVHDFDVLKNAEIPHRRHRFRDAGRT